MPPFAVRHEMPPRIARVICVFGLLAGMIGPVFAQLSDKIHAELLEAIPKYSPPAIEQPPPSPVGTPAPLSDDPLLELPVFRVEAKHVDERNPDAWLTPKAIEKKAMSDYSDSMTDLEWALNCWYIPFVTASPQARANAAYSEKKLRSEQQRLTALANVIATLDSAEAKKLLHDIDLSNHPGK